MLRTSLKRILGAAAVLLAAGCATDARSPVEPALDASHTIADAGHSGSVPGFHFLPPVVKAATFSGTFDPALSPRVVVCELSGAVCGPVLVEFTTAGSGSERVRVDAAEEAYVVNWHTGRFALDAAKFYRISVYQGSFLLGYADVDPVSKGGDLKNVDATRFVALKIGQTLPIKFRVETGIAAAVDVSPDTAEVEPGQTQQFTATVTDLHGNVIPGAPVAWASSSPAVATVDANGLATGVAPGTTTITATSGGASGSALLVVRVLNTPPVAGGDAFQAIGNLTVPVSAPGVLANDTDAESGSLQAVPGTFATAAGGSVTLQADGSFTYLSAPGFTGEDSFTYQATDGTAQSAAATVTLSVPSRVWYVRNNAASPGDGRDASPFTTLAQAEASSAPGEMILVMTGDGTSAGMDQGITLKPGQSLNGQGVSSDLAVTLNGESVTLLAAGSSPRVTNAGPGATIRLASGNTVQGIDVASSAGAGISGNAFGLLAVSRVNVAAAGGPALDLQNGDASAAFGTLSSAGSTGAGLRLVNVGGSVSANGGSLSGAAGAGVEIVGGDAMITYPGEISFAAARAASVTGRTGGAVTLSGSIQDTGLGIRVENNTGGSISFTGASKSLSTGSNDAVTLSGNTGASVTFAGGGLAIATTTGNGFDAAGGGTVTVTGADNTIASAGGIALRVVNAGIGATGLSFRSISANGGPSGIVLDNTGGLNGVQVTGDGSAGSGGIIQNTTGAGISLEDVINVRFNNVTVQNTGDSGVSGSGVAGFAFTDGAVQNSGTSLGADDSNIAFHAGPNGANVTGVVRITGNSLSGAFFHGVDIRNGSGTIQELNISGNTITSSTAASESRGSGIRVVAVGSAGAVANVSQATIASNVIRNFPTDAGIIFQGGNPNAAGPAGSYGVPGSASQVISITGNRISGASAGARMGSNAIRAAISGRGQGNLDISGNGTAAEPLTHLAGTAISVSAFGQVNVTSRVANNRIVANNSFAAQGIGVGLDNLFGLTDAPVLQAEISGNVISATDGNGILAVSRNSAGTLRARIMGNTVAAPLSGVRQGIRIDSGSALGNATVCLDLSGNTSAGAGGAKGIGLRKQGTNPAVNVYGIVGLAANASPAVEAYVDGLNPAGSGTTLLSAASGFSNCALP